MFQNAINPDPAADFADFDREFGAFLLRFTRSNLPEIALTGMLAAQELRSGNPQLDLGKYAGKTFEVEVQSETHDRVV